MSTEKNMYELYGYKPSNFQVQEVAKIGALSNYVEAESVLYFANNNGLYAYAGGVPRLVTERLSAPFPLGPSRLGSDGKNIFFSTEHFIVVYNLPTGLLSAQQGNGVVDFSFYEEKLYALFSNGKLQKFNDITALETINWMITLPTNYGDYFKNKTIKHIEVHAVMQTGSKMDFKIYHRNEQRETYVKTVQSSSQRAIVVPLNVLTNEFNLTIEGKGDVQINAIKVVYIKGGTL